MKSTRNKIVSCLSPKTSESMDGDTVFKNLHQLSLDLPPVNTTRPDKDEWSFPQAGATASPVRSPSRAGTRSTPRSPLASPRSSALIFLRNTRDLHRTYSSNAVVERYFSTDLRDRLRDLGLLYEVERAASDWHREMQMKEESIDLAKQDNAKLRDILQLGVHRQTIDYVATSQLDGELKSLRVANEQLRTDKAEMEKVVLEEGSSYLGRLQIAEQGASESLKRLQESQQDLKSSLEAQQKLRSQYDLNRSQLIEALQRITQLQQSAWEKEQEVVRLQTEHAEVEGGEAVKTLKILRAKRIESRASHKYAELREKLWKTQESLKQITVSSQDIYNISDAKCDVEGEQSDDDGTINQFIFKEVTK